MVNHYDCSINWNEWDNTPKLNTKETRTMKPKITETLSKIINDIKNENEKGFGLLSEDECNGRLLDILRKYGLEDDEDILDEACGNVGLIRDAEQGIYYLPALTKGK